jgi:hypothetical protein
VSPGHVNGVPYAGARFFPSTGGRGFFEKSKTCSKAWVFAIRGVR